MAVRRRARRPAGWPAAVVVLAALASLAAARDLHGLVELARGTR
jgi:hypothetical protein